MLIYSKTNPDSRRKNEYILEELKVDPA